VLPRATLRQLLEPFGLSLGTQQEDRLLAYLELLLRWNSRINLIGPSTAEECVTRHFGESLYLSRWVRLRGRLLDVGSGAGFPGLALKLLHHQLAVTLLEPVAKKRAFLKEAARTCQLDAVEILPDRIEVFARGLGKPSYDLVTARAVGGLLDLARNSAMCLKQKGLLCLWLGREQSGDLTPTAKLFQWQEPIPLPLSRKREIWVGHFKRVNGE